MSGHDEDDKPTVVLDLKALKKQKEEEAKKLEEMAVNLEFTATQSSVPDFKEIQTPKTEQKSIILLFDWTNDFFKTQMSLLPKTQQYEIISDIKVLSAKLKESKYSGVMFYFNQNPKAVNQLSAQIKAKFKDKKIIMIAKQLTPEKVKIHQDSPSGAHGYLSLPFTQEQVSKIFESILKQKAA